MSEPSHVLRLASPIELIGTIPYLLGFKPTCSLVAVGLRPHGTTFRSTCTLRSGLPAKDSISPFADYVVSHLAHHGVATVVFVSYDDDGEPSFDQALFDALTRQAALRDIDVHDALVVRAGRWRSHVCTNPQCCPPAGTPIDNVPGPGELTAIAAGLVAAPTRQALADSIKPVSEIAITAMEQELDAAGTATAALLGEPGGRDRLRAGSMALITTLLERHTPERPVKPSHGEAARLLFGLRDLTVRDECMRWTRGKHDVAALALWTELVRLSPPPMGAPPATLLAYAWWQRGHGAMANVALERALAHDRDYTMARLLVEAIQRGVRPDQLDFSKLLDGIS